MIGRKGDPDLHALRALLERENTALDRGDTRKALALVPEKEALLSRLESRGTDLRTRAEADAALRASLLSLQALLARNAARIDRLRIAAGEMAADLVRLRERHGLGGLYGRDGDARQKDVAAMPRIDREV